MFNDSFKKYLISLGQPETLTREEEAPIIARAQAGDSRAMRTLLRNHHPFVLKKAARVANRHFTTEEAFQAGMIGLTKGIKDFDDTVGVRLLTYAGYWITVEIYRASDNEGRMIRLPVNVCALARKFARFERAHLAKNGETLSNETLAEMCGSKSPERIKEIRESVAAQFTSTDKPVEDTGTATFGDMIPDSDIESALSLLENTEAQALLWRIVETELTELEQRIVQARFVEGRTLVETADDVAEYTTSGAVLTRERIRQIENQLLGKLEFALRNRRDSLV